MDYPSFGQNEVGNGDYPVSLNIYQRIIISFVVFISSVFLNACSAIALNQRPEYSVTHPLIGKWRLGTTSDVIEISRCHKNGKDLCGLQIAFVGKPTDRDYGHPDFMSWGQKKCKSQVVSALRKGEETQTFHGFFYDLNKHKNYNIILTSLSHNRVSARIYEGVSIDEGISMAVNTAIGSAPSVLDALSFASRAAFGKDDLGYDQIWQRVAIMNNRCDRQENFKKSRKQS